jgi:membrane protease YdiL (CAAX protease family)
LAVLLVVGGVMGASWAALPSAPAWLLAGAGLGAALVGLGGVDVRALWAGDLAFLAGPSRRSHALARAVGALFAAPVEEAAFRGAAVFPVAGGSVAWLPAVLGAVAFISRHHLMRGATWRFRRRTLLVEAVASCLLLWLAVASHSIWPGVLAHAINNLPTTVISLQQAAMAGQARERVIS